MLLLPARMIAGRKRTPTYLRMFVTLCITLDDVQNLTQSLVRKSRLSRKPLGERCRGDAQPGCEPLLFSAGVRKIRLHLALDGYRWLQLCSLPSYQDVWEGVTFLP